MHKRFTELLAACRLACYGHDIAGHMNGSGRVCISAKASLTSEQHIAVDHVMRAYCTALFFKATEHNHVWFANLRR